ncbi:hypothetical protein AGMMS50249_7120 [candidate division SR1 bacterium]|nr:hypothetical protein AGMMS50249_7120 [candidate division SR1 bacterium]
MPESVSTYIPSSSEKKQAVLMYLFVGLLLSLQQENISPYMHHHIKQAFGWAVLLVLVIFLDIILFIFGAVFGAFFSVLALFITIPTLLFGLLCAKQARDGNYLRNQDGMVKYFSAFSGLGNWILNLFDADHYKTIQNIPNPSPVLSQESQPTAAQIPTIDTQNAPETVAGIDLSQYQISTSKTES